MKNTLLLLFASGTLLLSGCKKDDAGEPGPEPDKTDYAQEATAWYARQSMTVSGDNTLDKWPTDGLSVVYEDINTITIEKFYLSCTPNVEGASDIRDIPVLDALPLTKEGDRVVIKDTTVTVTPRVNKNDPSKNQDEATCTISGHFEGDVLTLNLKLKTATKTADYVFTGLKKLTGASLISMTLSSDKVTVQPEIVPGNTTVMFYVKEGTDDADLNLVPVFEISEGATISQGGVEYVPGTKIDFSKDQKFAVKAQSGKKTTNYTVKHEVLNSGFSFASDFEAWELKNANASEANSYQKYDEPAGGWATSNEGVKFIKWMYSDLYSKESPYPVTPVTDAKSGTKAARLETLYTTGQAGGGFIPAIPKVTSGTVFTGIFKVEISNTLKSTKFGYPCLRKPVSFEGWYKYTPGTTYYYCANPAEANNAVVDNNKTDAPAINAVLYEVDSYNLDFLDGTNLLTSEKIVAKASLKDNARKDVYTSFKIDFDWGGKQFDKSKKYKLAIVCSSSKDGDKFSGAPGSVLWVDDLKVNFE